jgi:hypothetical protein
MNRVVDSQGISVGHAIVRGQLLVNGPALLLIAVGGYVGRTLAADLRTGMGIGVVVGAIVAWSWWSFAVPRWRRWALGRGADPAELQRIGVRTGLLWPRGSIFEKTELRPGKHDDTSGPG